MEEITEDEVTRIMVAVNQSSLDGYPFPSISSKGAFEWTIKKIVRHNVSAFNLLLLHVPVFVEGNFVDVNRIYSSPEDFERLEPTDNIRVIHLLEYFVRKCHEVGVACQAWILLGKPERIICNEVKRLLPDFLVLGNRDLCCFKRVFIHNVSEYCVKHATCPVITIKRKPEETPDDPVED